MNNLPNKSAIFISLLFPFLLKNERSAKFSIDDKSEFLSMTISRKAFKV